MIRESNIAVPGEWLFPLNDGPIDVDVAAQSKIRMDTEEFLENSAVKCQNIIALNASAKDAAVTSEATTVSITESPLITASFSHAISVDETDSPITTYHSTVETKFNGECWYIY